MLPGRTVSQVTTGQEEGCLHSSGVSSSIESCLPLVPFPTLVL